MEKKIIITAAMIIFVAGIAEGALAGENKSCLHKLLGHLKPNKKITLTDDSSRVISGKLLSMDIVQSTLTLYRSNTNFSDTITYFGSNISKIRWNEGRFRPEYMALGLGIGLLAGLMAASIEQGGRENESLNSLGTFFSFSGLGLIIGIIIPLDSPHEETIDCTPK